MRRIYLLLSSVMLLSLSCFADPTSVPIKQRPPLINTHGASRAPSLNQELRVMYDDDNSVLIFYCENAVHPFSYVISKVEDGCGISGEGIFDGDDTYALSTACLSSGIYIIEITIGTTIYEGEFVIE